MKLTIEKYPSSWLSTPVGVGLDETNMKDFISEELMESFLETMYENKGVGLAAPQVGSNIPMFVTHHKFVKADGVFILPKVIRTFGEEIKEREGCLSFGNFTVNVRRPRYVRLGYYNSKFKYEETTFSDMEARIILHSFDYLNGVTMLMKCGHLSKAQRKKLQKL